VKLKLSIKHGITVNMRTFLVIFGVLEVAGEGCILCGVKVPFLAPETGPGDCAGISIRRELLDPVASTADPSAATEGAVFGFSAGVIVLAGGTMSPTIFVANWVNSADPLWCTRPLGVI
jgi:hypothetical protein